MKLVVNLDRAVSLKDFTRHLVLADLAAAGRRQVRAARRAAAGTVGDRTGPRRLAPWRASYAGGNAVNFQPMAGALRGSGMAVYAVELPGHDLAAEREPFAPMAQVVEQVVDEITRRGLTGSCCWGHSAGAALAVETARRLQERGADVQRVFLGASCSATPPTGAPATERPDAAMPRSPRG